MIGNEGYELPIDVETARYICDKECNEEWCFFRELARRDIKLRKEIESIPRHSGDKKDCQTRTFILEKAPILGERYSRKNIIQSYFVSILKYKAGLPNWTGGLIKWTGDKFADAFAMMWPGKRDVSIDKLDAFYEEVKIEAAKIRTRESPLVGVVD